MTHTQNTDDPPWWMVDLNGIRSIARVVVWFRTDCCEWRNDDISVVILDHHLREVARRSFRGRPPRHIEIEFSPAVEGEIVRIEGQSPRTTSDGYLSLAEVEVLGPVGYLGQ